MRTELLVGDWLRIVPEDAEAAGDGRTVLRLARGAFGSGEHETTRSCLEVLGALDGLRGADVLDLGSGTGVLAIAALLRGARRAVCVDPDPRAVATARRNAVLNGVAGAVEHVEGTLADVPGGRRFQVVLANLYGDVLLPLLGDLAGRAAPEATLVLSGLAWEYDFAARRGLEAAGCAVIRHRMMEEYSTLVARAPASAEQERADAPGDGQRRGEPR